MKENRNILCLHIMLVVEVKTEITSWRKTSSSTG